MGIGERIAYYRKQRNLTQAALAEKLGVTFQAVSSWECETYAPDVSRLCELAEVLGTTPARLLKPSGAETLKERERFSREEHMYTFLKTAYRSSKPVQDALPFAREGYAGHRLPGSEVPFFNLPLTAACHCLAMGLDEAAAVAALLSYIGVKTGAETFPPSCPEQIRSSVRLFTAYKNGQYKKEALQNDRYACLLILLDAVHAPTAGRYSASETVEFAQQAEQYALPLAKVLGQGTEAENNAAWILSHTLMEQLETVRRFI